MSKKKKKIIVESLGLNASGDLSAVTDNAADTADEKKANTLISEIENAVKGLLYTSETDAEILPFVGSQTDAVTKENLLLQIKSDSDIKVEEKKINDFFDQLTEIQDWFGDEEKETAAKFSSLRDLLEKNLKDLKIFKVGKINIDIYAVGLDENSILTGIQTKAVES